MIESSGNYLNQKLWLTRRFKRTEILSFLNLDRPAGGLLVRDRDWNRHWWKFRVNYISITSSEEVLPPYQFLQLIRLKSLINSEFTRATIITDKRDIPSGDGGFRGASQPLRPADIRRGLGNSVSVGESWTALAEHGLGWTKWNASQR